MPTATELASKLERAALYMSGALLVLVVLLMAL